MRHEDAIIERKEGEEVDPISIVSKSLETLQSTVDDRLKAVADFATETSKIAARIDKLEAKANRPHHGGETRAEPTEERKALAAYIRHGERAPADSLKSLTSAGGTNGGYLVPSEFSTEVLKGIVEVSPMRQAARVASTDAGEVILPKRTGRPTAAWVGETEDRPETGSTYGQVEISVHEMSCYVDVSVRLIEDAAINVEAEVAFDLAQEFGRLESAAFITGDGVKKPMGFLNAPELSYTPTGNATTLGSGPADLLISHLYAMPATYRNRGSWMMNGSTLAAIRKLKDGTTGIYLWQPSYAAGQPETILGRPVIEAPDMPDVGSGTIPIAFGDFGTAYRIFDRVNMSLLRDPYSVSGRGLVRFLARRRVGGDMVMAEAVKAIKCATS